MERKPPLLLFCFIAAIAWAHSSDARELTFTTFRNAPIQKLSAQIISEAYATLDIKVSIKELPGLRALVVANSGETDGEISRIGGIEKKFTNLIAIPTPVNHIEIVVFSENSALKIENWHNLQGLKVGIVSGSVFTETLDQGLNTLRINNYKQLFTILKRGRVDVAVSPYINGLSMLKTNPHWTILPVSPSLQNEDLYHYIHKRHRHLIPKLNQIFQEMHSSGRIKHLRNQFLEELVKN
ncbi:substrate-binding periplasmic protein [Emcibacter sp.]|uniref:substrate-binding periplasmic protein n=1 Tax=Emcibacter sp. TaxID=1979954 RepID=UPI003A924AEF